MTTAQRRELIARAVAAKETSYSPYSRFRVGAAVLTDDGSIFDGCNVENASYGLAICAERNAIFRMAHAGRRSLVAVAVTSDHPSFITPCGACRQVIAEFAAKGTVVLLVSAKGRVKRVPFERIFPTPPDLASLKK